MAIDLDLAIVIAYLIITLSVGLYYGRGVKNIKEYAIGNRDFSTTVLVMTITATTISGGFIMLGASEAFKFGLIYILAKLGMAVGTLLYAYLIGPRIGRFFGNISVGGIMYDLYGKPGQIITGIASFIVCLGFVASQIKVMGAFFNYFMGIDAMHAVIISSIIVVVYSAQGGIRAVTFTDVLQFGTLMVAIPLIYSILMNIIGGYQGILSKVQDYHLHLPDDNASYYKYATLFMFYVIPFISPPTGQRMLMAKDTTQIINSFKYSGGIIALLSLLSGVIGIVAYAIDPNMDPNNSFLVIIDRYLPTGVKGLALIGLIAITMSTADSYMNAGSVAFTHDIVKSIFGDRLSVRAELILSKLVTIVVGVSAVFLALKFTSLLKLGLFMQSFYGPLVGMPLLFGMFGFKTSQKVFIGSVITSSIVVISWLVLGLEEKLGFDLHIPAMIVSALSLFLGHYLFKQSGGWVLASSNSFVTFSKLSKAYRNIKD